MRRLLGYMRPYSSYIAVALVFLLLQSALQSLGPLLTKYAVDRFLDPSPHRTATALDRYLSADPWTGIGQVGLLYLCVLVGAFLFEFGQIYLMQYVGQLAMFDLRRELM